MRERRAVGSHITEERQAISRKKCAKHCKNAKNTNKQTKNVNSADGSGKARKENVLVARP